VVVVAKIGISEKKGKIRTPEGIYEVSRAEDGWYTVAGPVTRQPGRVRYNDDRNLLEIQRPEVSVSIHFRPELEHTTFELNGHVYEVGTMDFGDISIKEGSRSVVRGHGTVSGVRLLEVAPEIEALERELAFGLALRSLALDKDLWREDNRLRTLFPGRMR
jgi:hypothetical protein